MPVTRSTGKGRRLSSHPSTAETTSESECTGSTESTGSAVTTATETTSSSMERTLIATPETSAASQAPALGGTTASASPPTAQVGHSMPPPTVSTGNRKPPMAQLGHSAPPAQTAGRDQPPAAPAGTGNLNLPRAFEVIAEASRTKSNKKTKRAVSARSSSTKANKIAKAKEEVIRLQLELAKVKLAVLETETDDEEDDTSITTAVHAEHTTVDAWWDSQPLLAITNEPHQRCEHQSVAVTGTQLPPHCQPPQTVAPPLHPQPSQHCQLTQPPPQTVAPPLHPQPSQHCQLTQPPPQTVAPPLYPQPSQHCQLTHPPPQTVVPPLYAPPPPTPPPPMRLTAPPQYQPQPPPTQYAQQPQDGLRNDYAPLAEAITFAVRAAQLPRYTELPIFNGAHQDWLTFQAAYRETAPSLSPGENVSRLRRCLKGRAKEAVEGLLITNTNPFEIMNALESRFGRPDSIAMAEIDTLRSLPRLTESSRDTCIFASRVSNVIATLKTLNCVRYLYNPEVAKLMANKLTIALKHRYFDYLATRPREEPDLLKFEQFMRKEADLCSSHAEPEYVTSQPPPTRRQPQRIHTVSEQNYNKCVLCRNTHALVDCEKFKKLEINARWEIAKNRKLCFGCLRNRTSNHNCRKKPCGIDGCKYFHNSLLHHVRSIPREQPATKEDAETINSAWTAVRAQSFLKILPVRVSGPAGVADVFALMDDGSTVTLVDEEVARTIGAKGPVDPLRIEVINNMKTEENSSRRVWLSLQGSNGNKERVQARTVRDLQVSSQEIPIEQIDMCDHLRDIKELVSYKRVKPQLLIGQDNWHLLLTSTVRKGNKNQPVASLTPLGWVLHGRQSRTLGKKIDFVRHMTEMPVDDNIEEMVKEYFTMDALCIAPQVPTSDPERRALKLLAENTKQTDDGKYETCLLWRSPDVRLPENYENSLRRLAGIERKLDRDPELKRKYTQQMDNLVLKGYAELAPTHTTEHRTWYLPHFAVMNAMKPDKLRVVHDAAAKTRGVSLNDTLLKGPDLLQSLPGVVMRFRQHHIAVISDIAEMFMQVKLREQDRDALRYLWRGERRDDLPPTEYRMTSLIFGAASSPSTAIYVKNFNASKYTEMYPEAAAAIVEKHYVDDYLDSFRNIEDAKRITSQVRDIHKSAGFELKQWVSNSTQLITALGEDNTEKNKDIYSDKAERVLGLIWRPAADELTFNLDLARLPISLTEGKRPTKREALRIVMSLFDPLGFAAPITIRAKQILQEVWRRGTGWDDYLEEDLSLQWNNWMTHLFELRSIALPRCYPGYSDADELQLHTFTDASELSYAAVVYWRARAPDGTIKVAIVLAKAKVASLKLTSIPRLELQAAVMGTRLAEAVIKEHERKPDSKTYWTDSKTTLTWIKTGARSYKPYVAHRVAAIEETTMPTEWRWLPSKLNVADDATRDVPTSLHRWYNGPEFLCQAEEDWPTETPRVTELTGEERTTHIVEVTKHRLSEALPDPERFSKWERLIRTAARVLQFIQLLKTKTQRVNYKRTKPNEDKDAPWEKAKTRKSSTMMERARRTKAQTPFVPVTAESLNNAEALLFRASQQDSFGNDIENLRKGQPLDKDSRIKQYSLKFEDDTLKMRSRIKALCELRELASDPPVIDGNNRITRLWIDYIHRTLHHAGVEATVNECRQQYWVVRLRPSVRTVIKQCLHCRLRAAQPPCPRTGDLPSCRLAHHRRPFTYTGVDYFGPLQVTVGRARHKRYAAIFTCLTTRAVHLEVAASLTTDSAIMALRRMIARRGCPTQIWSDNGTNLRGADREMRRALDDAARDEAAKRGIEWRFIPPGAPFMGGAWERMVRSVKTALAATLHERYPTEEVLHTLLAEAEYTVNSRPLTHVSVSPEDPEALTPNHFLLGGPGRVPQPGTFNEHDEISRSAWRTSQRLADIFWQRWLREYLPELQHRREPHGHGTPIKLGDLVQLVDPNLPRNVWVRGRVIATYPGPDNVVRTVDLQTRGGILRRPVRKLITVCSVGPAPEPDARTSHGGRDVQDDA